MATSVSTPEQRAGKIDPTVEPAPPEGWRRWAAELGHYDQDRVAEFGGVVIAGAAIGIAFLYFFVKIADEVLGKQTASLDAAASTFVRGFGSPAMDVVARAISFMGSEGVFALSLVLLILFVWQRRWGAAAMLVLITAGVQLLNDFLKTIFQRTRPEPLLGIITAQQYSFPSGHAMVSSAFYFYLGYLCWRLATGVWRFVLIGGLVLLVLLIGVSRIYLQAHYFTDVIAGYLAGLLWADAVIIGGQLLITRRMPRFGRGHRPRTAHTLSR